MTIPPFCRNHLHSTFDEFKELGFYQCKDSSPQSLPGACQDILDVVLPRLEEIKAIHERIYDAFEDLNFSPSSLVIDSLFAEGEEEYFVQKANAVYKIFSPHFRGLEGNYAYIELLRQRFYLLEEEQKLHHLLSLFPYSMDLKKARQAESLYHEYAESFQAVLDEYCDAILSLPQVTEEELAGNEQGNLDQLHKALYQDMLESIQRNKKQLLAEGKESIEKHLMLLEKKSRTIEILNTALFHLRELKRVYQTHQSLTERVELSAITPSVLKERKALLEEWLQGSSKLEELLASCKDLDFSEDNPLNRRLARLHNELCNTGEELQEITHSQKPLSKSDAVEEFAFNDFCYLQDIAFQAISSFQDKVRVRNRKIQLKRLPFQQRRRDASSASENEQVLQVMREMYRQNALEHYKSGDIKVTKGFTFNPHRRMRGFFNPQHAALNHVKADSVYVQHVVDTLKSYEMTPEASIQYKDYRVDFEKFKYRKGITVLLRQLLGENFKAVLQKRYHEIFTSLQDRVALHHSFQHFKIVNRTKQGDFKRMLKLGWNYFRQKLGNIGRAHKEDFPIVHGEISGLLAKDGQSGEAKEEDYFCSEFVLKLVMHTIQELSLEVQKRLQVLGPDEVIRLLDEEGSRDSTKLKTLRAVFHSDEPLFDFPIGCRFNADYTLPVDLAKLIAPVLTKVEKPPVYKWMFKGGIADPKKPAPSR